MARPLSASRSRVLVWRAHSVARPLSASRSRVLVWRSLICSISIVSSSCRIYPCTLHAPQRNARRFSRKVLRVGHRSPAAEFTHRRPFKDTRDYSIRCASQISPRTGHTREPDPTHNAPSTQPHAKQQLTNATRQTSCSHAHTHLPRRTMPINRRHRPASQPHSLSHPHARAHSPVEPSPARAPPTAPPAPPPAASTPAAAPVYAPAALAQPRRACRAMALRREARLDERDEARDRQGRVEPGRELHAHHRCGKFVIGRYNAIGCAPSSNVCALCGGRGPRRMGTVTERADSVVPPNWSEFLSG